MGVDATYSVRVPHVDGEDPAVMRRNLSDLIEKRIGETVRLSFPTDLRPGSMYPPPSIELVTLFSMTRFVTDGSSPVRWNNNWVAIREEMEALLDATSDIPGIDIWYAPDFMDFEDPDELESDEYVRRVDHSLIEAMDRECQLALEG